MIIKQKDLSHNDSLASSQSSVTISSISISISPDMSIDKSSLALSYEHLPLTETLSDSSTLSTLPDPRIIASLPANKIGIQHQSELQQWQFHSPLLSWTLHGDHCLKWRCPWKELEVRSLETKQLL